MPFSIVCVAPGATEAQVIDLASSMGEGWWEFDTLPTTVSKWWRKNQNGPGYSCISCYNTFGTGRKVKTASSWPSPSSLRNTSSRE